MDSDKEVQVESGARWKCEAFFEWIRSTTYAQIIFSVRNIVWILAVSTCCFFMIKQVIKLKLYILRTVVVSTYVHTYIEAISYLDAFLFQMTHCLDKLSNPPVSTQTRILMLDTMTYPAVTFCFKNFENEGYDLAILQVRTAATSQTFIELWY